MPSIIPEIMDRGARVIAPLHTARILIVDDQEANVRLLENLLRREGYSALVSTTDSREVLFLYTSSKPDLVLLDLMMPYIDGFEVMQSLRSFRGPGTGDQGSGPPAETDPRSPVPDPFVASYQPVLVLTA